MNKRSRRKNEDQRRVVEKKQLVCESVRTDTCVVSVKVPPQTCNAEISILNLQKERERQQ